MTLEDAMQGTWKEAMLTVGLVCVAAGLILRQQRLELRGLGMALVAVGALMIAAWPAGRYFQIW